jgi:hypothetical protein
MKQHPDIKVTTGNAVPTSSVAIWAKSLGSYEAERIAFYADYTLQFADDKQLAEFADKIVKDLKPRA